MVPPTWENLTNRQEGEGNGRMEETGIDEKRES